MILISNMIKLSSTGGKIKIHLNIKNLANAFDYLDELDSDEKDNLLYVIKLFHENNTKSNNNKISLNNQTQQV